MSNQSTLIDPPDWLDRDAFPFKNHQLPVLGHQIHYVDEGHGPTILLLHGNGSWSFGFRYLIPLLSPHYRVVAPDYPGLGLSKAKAGFSFKPKDHSDVIEAFVDILGLRDIRLFVEDWGGPIGLGLAGRRPELIHSMIITNTWAWPAQGYPALEKFSRIAGSFVGRFAIQHFNVLARFGVPKISIARTLSAAELEGYAKPYPTAESRLPMAIFPREILASHEYLAEVESGLDRLADKPVVIIWGEKDAAFGATERGKFQSLWKDATTVLLPEAKHFVHVDEPDATAEAILEFEKRTESKASARL